MSGSPAASACLAREARRLSRERIEVEAGRKLSDKELDRLIDKVLETNESRTS